MLNAVKKLVKYWYVLVVLVCISSIPALVRADTQSVSVTGSVAPHSSDFQIALSSTATGTLSQNQLITYTITYGSHLDYTDNITLEAYWDQGTIAGSNSPSIDGMDYVGSSAINAYGNTNPIVNLTSQKITWSIASFPSQTTNRTVTFQLKTNGSYTGTPTVDFPVRIRLLATNYTTAYQTTHVIYQYNPSQVTPTPGPTATPTPGSSANSSTTTPIPTFSESGSTTGNTTSTLQQPTTTPKTQSITAPASNAPVQNVTVVNVSDNSTQIALNLNKTKTATVVYGLSPASLTNQSPIAVNGTDGSLSLNNLTADTTYYMQIVTTDTSGNTKKSDVFAVQTAQTSAQPQVANASLVVASDSNVLYSAGLNTGSNSSSTAIDKTPQIPVSQGTNYNFAFKLTKANKIKNVIMTLSNTSVLGVSNFQTNSPQPLQYSFPVAPTGNGVYGVQIKNPTVPGTYDVFVKITDFDGNVTTQKIAEIKVLRPFRVYDAETKKPIEDARIVLFRLNSQTNRYDLIPNFGGTSNPVYTNYNGEVSEPLPKGTYKANFGRIGYRGQDNVYFSLGTTATDDFPTVYLRATGVTPLALFTYYRNALTDYVGTTAEYIAAIQQSYRYFDLLGLLVIFCFIILALLLFTIKSHIHFVHFPLYFHHHMLTFFHQNSGYIRGTIVDKATKLPISQAMVILIDERTNRMVSQVISNTKGGFLFAQKDGHHSLRVLKAGYEPSEPIGYTPDIVVSLQPGDAVSLTFWRMFAKGLEDGLSLFFEFVLIISLLLEIAFFPAFGLMRTLPGLAASIFNIILWIFFLREKGKQLS